MVPTGWSEFRREDDPSLWAAICEVRGFGELGQAMGFGVGWRSALGYVVTAAHVLDNAATCKVRFMDDSDWTLASGFARHPSYRTPGDPYDVAKVLVVGTPGGLHVGSSVPLAGVAVTRRTQGALQASTSMKAVGPYVGHDALTQGGDSGSPILAAGKVIGITLGGGAAVHRYLKPSQRRQMDTYSAALALTSKALAGIQKRKAVMARGSASFEKMAAKSEATGAGS